MTDRSETNKQTIVDWAGDLVALVSHIEEALDHQLKLKADSPESGALIQELHDSVKAAKDRAVSFQESVGTTAGNPVIKAGSEMLGKAAGVIDRMRNDSVAKALRDDYTALNHLAIAYSMFHTTSMALNHDEGKRVAGEGLRTCARLIQKINHAMPQAVMEDLAKNKDVAVVDPLVVEECRKEIDQIWKETDQSV